MNGGFGIGTISGTGGETDVRGTGSSGGIHLRLLTMYGTLPCF